MIKLVGLAVIASWITLLATSHGVLFYGEQIRLKGYGQDTLNCSYFTGAGTVTQEYWYNANGMMGRAACPRLVAL